LQQFWYRRNRLYCEDVPVAEIAHSVGTPFYLYSQSTLERHFRTFDGAFSAVPHLTCFAVKANSNLAVLSLFRRLGAGFDIVSGGELERALKAGADPRRIVFSGVGKNRAEMDRALACDILQFNVESQAELEILEARAQASGKVARVGLRINPDVDPKTHPYISTGLRMTKFGVPIEVAHALFHRSRRSTHLQLTGLGFHIGSQITRVEPFVEALKLLREAVLALRARKHEIRLIDLGGGLGITYNDELPPHPEDYGRSVLDLVSDLGCTVLLEPGRVLVGNAGILVTQVLLAKRTQEKNFVVVDAGMNDLMRPSLYGSYHAIQPVTMPRRKRWVADVVGPICESGDFLARDRDLPIPRNGDLLAVMSAGAYGFVLSSNYNSRPRAAEVMVSGGRFKVVRKRESFRDLVRGESLSPL
jgi:diaminopimelate decarboxylase